LGAGYPTPPCGLPGSSWERATPVPSLFGLAPGGCCQHSRSPWSLVGSYPTVSPLPGISHRRSRFCGPIRSIRVSPDAPGDYPAPCPLELGLSSPRYREATTRTTTPIFTNYLALPCQDPKCVGKCYLSLPLFMVMNNVLFLRFKFLHPSFKGGELLRFFEQAQTIERACKE